jgi:hypothetical protein
MSLLERFAEPVLKSNEFIVMLNHMQDIIVLVEYVNVIHESYLFKNCNFPF